MAAPRKGRNHFSWIILSLFPTKNFPQGKIRIGRELASRPPFVQRLFHDPGKGATQQKNIEPNFLACQVFVGRNVAAEGASMPLKRWRSAACYACRWPWSGELCPKVGKHLRHGKAWSHVSLSWSHQMKLPPVPDSCGFKWLGLQEWIIYQVPKHDSNLGLPDSWHYRISQLEP